MKRILVFARKRNDYRWLCYEANDMSHAQQLKDSAERDGHVVIMTQEITPRDAEEVLPSMYDEGWMGGVGLAELDRPKNLSLPGDGSLPYRDWGDEGWP